MRKWVRPPIVLAGKFQPPTPEDDKRFNRQWDVAAPAPEAEHPATDQCGFDRNASHSAGVYVCACGWQEADAGEEIYKAIRRECDEKLARFSTRYIEDARTIEALRQQVAKAETRSADLEMQFKSDMETTLRLLGTIKYLIGIAERGEGREIRGDETAEKFVLGYVKKIEAENAVLREEIRELNQMGFTHENAAAQKAALEDAERWNVLPAFLEKYQLDYVGLKRDIDAAIDAARKA